jgi:hypothetical protein
LREYKPYPWQVPGAKDHFVDINVSISRRLLAAVSWLLRIHPSRLTEGQQATLRALILRGPDPERDGVSSWTHADIADLDLETLAAIEPPRGYGRD